MTRRLVAVLSADAVGDSRLIAADEKAALRQVDAQRALLRQHIEAQRELRRTLKTIDSRPRRHHDRPDPRGAGPRNRH